MTYHPNEVARRARGASIALVALFLFLAAAFFRTQIIRYDLYARLSEQNRLEIQPLPAPRGIIYDRHGHIIAENIPGFRVLLHSPSRDSLRAALERLNKLVPLRTGDIDRLVNLRTGARPTLILSDASFEQVAVLEEHKITHFPGLVIQATPKRSYPDGDAVAAFTGYTKEINDQELEAPRYEGYKQGQQIGALGLEEEYESLLAGQEGSRFVEVDAMRRIVRVDGVRPIMQPVAGNDLHTNIDLELQKFIVDSVFADTLAAGVIAMVPTTGEVLALHSGPSFDPNDFIGGISGAKWSALMTDPRKPMLNKVLRGRYEPASTYKLVTAIIALQENEVSLGERMTIPCRGSITVGNRAFHCWKADGHGPLTLEEAVEQSCNVYFYQLGQKLGLSRMLAAGVRMGFAAATGIDLPGEQASLLPANVEYYNEKWGPRNWSAAGEQLNISIGQGEAFQTIANMARFYTALATDGRAARPRLVRGEPEHTRLYEISAVEQRGIQDALAGVVSRGTAIGSRQAQLTIAGKTGTAENPHGPAHAWFVGYAPAENPQLLIAILVPHGLHGSDAARRASRMFSFYFKQENVRLMETGG